MNPADSRRKHGFVARLIECECGLTFTPDRFDAHLRDEAIRAIGDAILPKRYGLRNPATPRRPHAR